MPSLAIVTVTPPPNLAHPKMVLLGDAGSRITVPYAPMPTSLDSPGEWEEVARPGAGVKPLLVRGDGKLQTLSFDLTVGFPDLTSIEALLDQLRKGKDGSERWAVSYGPQERGLWRMTGLQISVEDRQEWTNLAVRASVSLGLTEAGPSVRVGPVTGGRPAGMGQPPATYTVKRGDTLPGVAVKFYGSTAYAGAIATANGMRNSCVIRTGQVLKLPRI